MLTVVMTTRDRSVSLARSLDAWTSVAPPAGGFRLVVVDDGSRDATADVLADAARRLPLLAIHAERRGQNAARNRALAHLEGDLVVLTDDDAVPRSDALVRLREAADAHPEADVIVGTVVPRFEVEPPAWVLRSVRAGPSFAWLERPADGPVDPTEALSPVFALRAARFAAGLRFDETIGPDGTAHYAMGSETELLLRLRRDGATAWYARRAVVEHVVTAAQLAPTALLGRAYRYGRGRWRLRTARLAGARVTLRGVPLALVADLGARRLAHVRARLGRDVPGAFRAAWRLAYLAGQAAEARGERGASGLGALRWLLPASVRDVVGAGAPRVAPACAGVPLAPAGASTACERA